MSGEPRGCSCREPMHVTERVVVTGGYNHQNPHCIETAEEAQRIDERIGEVWRLHPRRF